MGIRRRVVNFLAEFKTWMANGQGYANDLKYPLGLATAIKIWFPSMSWYQILFLTLGTIVLMVFAGWIDLRYFQLHQRMMDIQTEKYNPYFQRLNRKFK